MELETDSAQQYAKRREAGAASRIETRRRLLAAADRAFRTRGYAQSSVATIAKDAGVALQTLYLAWGSKHALLRAATDAAASDMVTPLAPDQWHDAVVRSIAEQSGSSNAAADYLDGFATVFVDIAVRTADYWQINRDAAAVDPEAAANWTSTLQARRVTVQAIAEQIPVRGRSPALSTGQIADTLWAIASPDSFALLTVVGSYSSSEYRVWLSRTLIAALAITP